MRVPRLIAIRLLTKERILLKKGEIHYIGGSDILPPPLQADRENGFLFQ